MIRIDKSRTIENCSVYGDDQDKSAFYVLPDQPRFRLDDNGNPVFKMLKYRTPIPRADGSVGGGFVIFDSEFVVPDDKMKKIQSTLDNELSQLKPPINSGADIRKLTYIKGTASLQLLDSGGAMVQKIQSAGKPSLYGKNICSFTAELSQNGATLAEQAFQGKGGVAQVIYDLYFSASIGPITGHVYFFASKVYSFAQTIATDQHWYGDTHHVTAVNEALVATQAGGIDFDFTALGNMADTDAATKIENQIRSWGTDTLTDALKNQLPPDIVPPSDDDGGSSTGGGSGGSANSLDRYTRILPSISITHFSDFDQRYNENQAVPWHVVPQGTLPNITADAKLKWKDYCVDVDLNDPFFQQIHVKAQVNCDFKKFPIQSVDLHLEYPGGAQANAHIVSPDTVLSLDAFVVNKDYHYTYSYVVNYVDSDFTLKIPATKTDNGSLTIDIGALGLLYVDIGTGAINFDEVEQVQVTMKYEDPANKVALIQKEYVITKDAREFQFQAILQAPWNLPYTYDLLYVMTSGKKWQKLGQQSQSQELYINDPFSDTRTYNVIATGDLDNDVANIFVSLQYDDDDNDYHVHANPTTLNKANPFFAWTVPMIDATKGKVRYSAQIVYKKGAPDAIPLTVARGDSIFVGPVNQMQVIVDPVGLDFTSGLKFAKVSVHYADQAHDVDLRRDIILKPTTDPVTWTVDLRDKTKTAFEWTATYYLAGAAGALTTKTTALTQDPGGESVTLLPTVPA